MHVLCQVCSCYLPCALVAIDLTMDLSLKRSVAPGEKLPCYMIAMRSHLNFAKMALKRPPKPANVPVVRTK